MIIAILLAVAGVLAGGAAAALLLTRVRGIRGQLLLLSLAAAVLPAAAVVGAGLIMFSAHDVLALLVLAAASAGTAAVLAALLASRLAHRVAAFRDAAAGLAAGDFAVRIPEEGPEELRELGVAFNRMTESLSRLFETRRNLVAWASHDLRAPLASLQVMIEALEDGLAQPAQYLPAMREQVRTLSRLVDD
ncbi:MAG TPA: HAMP domain-containing protein, partial [Candidatus Acidoferrales bacterium]|nr:HAMP domain-containing protein [Candidatus Acidoferrales bacterium]